MIEKHSNISASERVAEYLTERSIIGCWTSYHVKERCINLRTQEMFENLVDLYAQVFMSQWKNYAVLMDCFPFPLDVSPHIYAARCYISMWFIDLYVSNCEAARKLSLMAFDERYHEKLCSISHHYDNYLTLLNASIRPTHIKNEMHNAQYIPIIAECIDVKNPNPFGINNFTPERNIFHGLIHIMKERNLLHFAPLSSDASGRPCWLFDWHSKDKACSWFPSKDNFDMEDVNLAFILGTACTPNLGARDADEWQYFAQGIVPHDPKPQSYERVGERGFYGSYEVRTMEIDHEFSFASIFTQIDQKGTTPTKKPRKNDPEIAITTKEHTLLGEEADPPMPQKLMDQIRPRFRLIDWVYYARVIRRTDIDSRTIALGIISIVGFGDEYV